MTVMYKKVTFWNVNESANPFLISNFIENDNFFEKMAKKKSLFMVKKNSWTAYKAQFWESINLSQFLSKKSLFLHYLGQIFQK